MTDQKIEELVKELNKSYKMRTNVGGGIALGGGVLATASGVVALIATGPVGWVVGAGIFGGVISLGGSGFKLGNWLYNKKGED